MTVVATLSEWLLQRRAERTIRAYTDEQRERVGLCSTAADARRDVARRVRAPSQRGLATELARAALVQRLCAFAASKGDPLDPASADDLERELRRAGEASECPKDLLDAASDAVKAGAEALAYDRLRGAGLDAMKSAMLDVDAAIAERIEARPLSRVRVERWSRFAAIGVAVAWAALAAFHSLHDAPNVAFHKRVNASRIDGANGPGMLVDGVRDALDGVVVAAPSADTGQSWFDVDLGGVYAIDHVVVTNRKDRSFDSSLPLVLEASNDGVAFTQVEERRTHFTEWVARPQGLRTRHLRVRTKNVALLGLNELDIFGRYSP